MSSPVSSAATQQQFFQQVPQNAPKPDVTNQDSTKSLVSTASQSTGGGTALFQSAYTRNADGTFGPKHTIKPPFNPLKNTASSSNQVGVDVKV